MDTNPQIEHVAPISCDKCPRLVEYLCESKKENPEWFNGPVPSFGSIDAEVLIIGLAPGLRGANRTGRPFTGDFAGEVLYQTLLSHGFASKFYEKNGNDKLTLKNVRITNAVRCVPPGNKPIGIEINNCRVFLSKEINRMSNLKVILCLGRIAHNTLVRHFKLPAKNYIFEHCKQHLIKSNLKLLNSYHCSRYNVNTNRLTEVMFNDVFVSLKEMIVN